MIDADLSAAPDATSPAPAPARFADLWLHPTRFFAGGRGVGQDGGLVAAAYVAGLAGAMDRLDVNMLRAQAGGRPLEGAYASIATSWTAYWGWMLAVGLVGAAGMWVLGAWWYRVRLGWAGDPRPDRDRAREVYLTAALIRTVPAVLVVALATLTRPNYAATWETSGWLDVLALIFPPWAIVASYRGVRASFAVTPGRARLWFLVLPLVHFVTLVLILGVAASLGSAPAEG